MGCPLVRYLLLALLMAGTGVAVYAAEETPMVVLLKDGREVSGRLVREDDDSLILRAENGEERGIAKARIEKVIRGAVLVPNAQPAQPGQPGAEQAEALKKMAAENRVLLQELRDLGDPNRDKRRAAMGRVAELGPRAEPLLVGILHPKEKMPVELRLGALRALATLGVISADGAKSIAWVAMKDADFEVRREACRTIRILGDDRAVVYILQYAASEDVPSQRASAWALREIDDLRSIAALVSALPPPQATSSMPDTGPIQGQWRELPTGPYGQKMPVFMPQGQAAGGTANVGNPAADALKLIAGKDLGSHPMAWHYWFRQKIGTLTNADVEKEYEKRTMLDRMNAR
jgi:HEAT repeat protein